MATLNYNRIAICIVSVIVLWVLAAAFRSHSSLSLQDLKDIAKGISVSTGFGGKGKTQEDDLIDHLEIDDSVPPPTVHTSTETSWGQGTGYDGYDEYDILPPGVHDLEAAEEEFKEHHQHTAPFGGESTNKWGEDNIDDYYDPIVPGHDASGTSNLHGTENGEKPSWEGQTSSSSSGSKESSHHSSGGSTKDWTLHDFQKAYLHHELGGDSGKELQRACANAAFSGNVVMHMLHVRGGLTNVRAGILDLVWFAILTGSDLVLPQYIIRPDATAPHNWDDESLGYYGLENMFDREWFLEFMGKHCPQMTIYPEINAVPYTTMFEHSEGFSDARYYLELSNTEAQLINTFNMWLHGFSDFQPNGVNLVFVNKMLWDFNWIPRPRLRKDMGHLLRISPEIRELAATALYNLRTEMHLDTIQPDAQIYDDAYLAVHLRTEPDAQQMGWTNDYGGFEMQSDHYIEECKKLVRQEMYTCHIYMAPSTPSSIFALGWLTLFLPRPLFFFFFRALMSST